MHVGTNSWLLSDMSTGQGDSGSTPQQPQRSRAADAILSLNQFALGAIRSILGCSCFGNPQVLLIISVICSEITAWYRQVVEIYSQPHGGPCNSAADNTVRAGVEIRKRDFFIGNHRLGTEVEKALIREVISGMVQELQVLWGDGVPYGSVEGGGE